MAESNSCKDIFPTSHVSYQDFNAKNDTEVHLGTIVRRLCNSDKRSREWAFETLPEAMNQSFGEFALAESCLCSHPVYHFKGIGTENVSMSFDFQNWPHALHRQPEKIKQEIQLLFQIWRSLFYFLYLTDEQDTQDKFIDTMCKMEEKVLFLRDSGVSIMWTFAAWYYLSIKWAELDQWRLDKYLYFARKLFESTVRRHPSSFVIELLKNFYTYPEHTALGMHIIDVFLEGSILYPAIPSDKFHELFTGLFCENHVALNHKPFQKRVKKWIIEPIVGNKVVTTDILSALPLILETIRHRIGVANTSSHLRRVLYEYYQSLDSYVRNE